MLTCLYQLVIAMIKLEKKYIQFGSATCFDNALDICAQPLLDDKIITDEYIKKIKKLVKNEGCYFVLLNRIAFAHYNTDCGSNEVGLSVLVLDDDVKCDAQDMKIMLLLSGKTKDLHLELLQFISNKLRRGMDQKLIECKSVEDVLTIFNES